MLLLLYYLPMCILLIVAIVLGVKLIKLVDLKIRDHETQNAPPPKGTEDHGKPDQSPKSLESADADNQE